MGIVGSCAFRWIVPVSLACAAVVPGAASAQSLYVIPTEGSAPVVESQQPLRVLLHARDPERLAGILGVQGSAAGTDTLSYVLDRYPAIQGLTERTWLDATFVLDYRDEKVMQLTAAFMKGLGRKPAANEATRAALVGFVAGTVKGSQDQGFDIASEVATRRQGDCTEYAVLTAALARSIGIPARVVLGLAVVAEPKQYGAYGHAWAEVRIGDTWVVADAALAGLELPLWYLPFGVLENEGMGYTMDVARLTPVWVQRVEVLGPLEKGR